MITETIISRIFRSYTMARARTPSGVSVSWLWEWTRERAWSFGYPAGMKRMQRRSFPIC